MKRAPKITDYVTESKACGFAGFSNGPGNIAKLRASVPHTTTWQGWREVRHYLVSDCVAYKVARESIGALNPPR